MHTVEQFSVRTIVLADDRGFMQYDPAIKRGFRRPEIKAVHPCVTFDEELFTLMIQKRAARSGDSSLHYVQQVFQHFFVLTQPPISFTTQERGDDGVDEMHLLFFAHPLRVVFDPHIQPRLDFCQIDNVFGKRCKCQGLFYMTW